MKPTLQHFHSLCPEVDEGLVREHLGRLGEDYFERFELEQVSSHLRGLASLTPEEPITILLEPVAGDVVECTFLSYDYPSVFSLITGVLCSIGFSILSGDSFTYRRVTESSSPASGRRSPASRRTSRPGRRKIVDRFVGSRDPSIAFEAWGEKLRRGLVALVRLVERGDAASSEEAKQRVNEVVTRRLAELRVRQQPVLYPVSIEVDTQSASFTRLKVVAQDTPAFLYALSATLTLHGLSIEQVRLRTVHGRVEDEIDVVDAQGCPVRDPELLAKIKLSVLLTKQFTYFLDQAPDPYAALSRFGQLADSILRLPEGGDWVDFLSNPRTMQDLARILGASDFLWEDFIRLQYEELLPILRPQVSGLQFSNPSGTLDERLRGLLGQASTFDEKVACLNGFKDREIFLIDLDHILTPGSDFRWMAERLTALAEAVVRAATSVVYEDLCARFGRPTTVGHLEATHAVMGLGKLGSVALGYASDIELLFVYSDGGRTDGSQSLNNTEFFGKLARGVSRCIEAKREGIFQVDLRLRPYGDSGPAACSLENFCTYYGPGGDAHAAERLALVRMRTVAGDATLGARLERLRDEYLYSGSNIDVDALRELRHKQFEDKKGGGRYNAKFSPGALVDVEYAVQILQVRDGQDHPGLRTPRIHVALEELEKVGVIGTEEFRRLTASYDFLRRLINGLRMLRGSAVDLFLPVDDTDEYVHLARRMGYATRDGLEPEQQLRLEFETRTAEVRAFVERHFGRESLPGRAMGNVADLVLSASVPEELRKSILSEAAFQDASRAYANLQSLAGEGERRSVFARLAVLACDVLRHEPDPDMALNNWDRFVTSLPDAQRHYESFLSQPKRLEILLAIFSRSQFLADTLIRDPEFLGWVTDPDNLHTPRRGDVLARELRGLAAAATEPEDWLNSLRRFRRREVLRIGARDMCLRAAIPEIGSNLSTLATAILEVALEEVWKSLEDGGEASGVARGAFCVLAFGKLGGDELNYSSDIDLIGVYDENRLPGGARDISLFARALTRLHSDLTRHTSQGHAFRVDYRLRPYGGVGEVVSTLDQLETYYRDTAALWEIQALLKLRPVAGNLEVGYDLLERLHPILLTERDKEAIKGSIRDLRAAAVKKSSSRLLGSSLDVKNGVGGIRDIEFLVQGLQLMHAPGRPELLGGNTLGALKALRKGGLVPPDVATALREDYVLLRRVEHCLQILHDRQTYSVPDNEAEQAALAKRVIGTEHNRKAFIDQLNACMVRVREAYEAYLG